MRSTRPSPAPKREGVETATPKGKSKHLLKQAPDYEDTKKESDDADKYSSYYDQYGNR